MANIYLVLLYFVVTSYSFDFQGACWGASQIGDKEQGYTQG